MDENMQRFFKGWRSKGNYESFVFDGVVDDEKWRKLKDNDPKILFILKDTHICYDNLSELEKEEKTCDIAKALKDDKTKESANTMWRRVTEWAYGLFELYNDKNRNILPYEKVCERYDSIWNKSREEYFNEHIKFISILNLKKTFGDSSVSSYDLLQHTKHDKPNIIEEIERIKPTIIICGGTFGIIKEEIYDNKEDVCSKSYFKQNINGDDVPIFNFCHPACRSSKMIMYYGLMGMVQQYLLENKEDNHGSNNK
ncbi:MAG: hypothetical protein ACI4YB_04765 [Oscillospiraceae bacterium]